MKSQYKTPPHVVLSVVVALLLAGCGISISDPIEEPVATVATPTATMVIAVRASATPRGRLTETPSDEDETATPTPELTPSITATPRLYTVVQGDTLGIIAIRFQVTVEALLAANNMTNGDQLQIGQTLVIPSASQVVEAEIAAGTQVPTVVAADGNPIYFVKVGDTISSIADAHNVSRDDLMAANGLRPDSQLTAGDTLIIPTGAYTPIPTATALAATPVPTVEIVLAAPSATVAPTAPADATATATATAGMTTHTVAAGETAGVIARNAGVTVEALKAANPGVDLDKLQIGQVLNVPSAADEPGRPAPTAPAAEATATPLATSTPSNTPTPVPTVWVTHVVTEGETFESVAGKYGSTAEILKGQNSTITTDLTPEAAIQVPVTVTPQPTRVPSPTPTVLAMKYQTPMLLAPADGGVWVQLSGKPTPMLLWTSVGILDENEYYVVRLRAVDTQGNLLWSQVQWTQVTNWRLEPDLLSQIEGSVLLRWDVMVMKRTSAEGIEPIVGDPLSGKSDSYTIRFTSSAN